MHFAYVVKGIENLEKELAKPFKELSVHCMPHGEVMSATFWRVDGTGVEISSEVHDVADRLEIGNLRFALSQQAEERSKKSDPFFPIRNYSSPLSATEPLEVTRLVIYESGSSADGGVLLNDHTGKQIVLLASAYPYCIALKGVSPDLESFASEYPFKDYKQVKFEGEA